MVDITHKQETLRKAIAQAVVVASSPATVEAVRQGKVPKGDVFEMSKAAGLFAVKRTSDMIPDCHPLPVEYTKINHEIDGLNIIIKVEVKTIYKTGVEVEAMHGASVVALTIYDMLKPIDKGIEIHHIKLLSKTGGKSDYADLKYHQLTGAIIACSGPVFRNEKENKISQPARDIFNKYDITISFDALIPDDMDKLQAIVKERVAAGDRLIVIGGGTGLTPGDKTPEAIVPLLDRRVPGIEEVIRSYGQKRTPYSMFSRSVAGLMGNTLILALPGSSKGMKESLDVLFPHVLNVFRSLKVE
ncbi:MAG: bifunctional molybdenum cofactor biosynthesis protein MoaC/MoaB [Cyclobacteriaceae bacterium]|nr:bifunctional molybdenum cofactor biosynthesis protein MoaC/MoaB [Cyclobacteriaceae bacterium]